MKCLFFFVVSLLVGVTACTTGSMNLREVHYYAVTNGENTNYYRLRIAASTNLGVAGYRSGWFPARAIDRLFGDVSLEGGAAELQVRSQIESLINDKIISTYRNWLEAAGNPDADPAKLERLLKARQQILAYPSREIVPYPPAIEIEYNPARGVATFHADEKVVFVLASNPDEVIGKIASFVEDDKTVLTINHLTDVVQQRLVNEITTKEAALEVDKKIDAQVQAQINQALGAKTAEEAINDIDTLLPMLETILY
jgi:hypothetical protein